MCPQERLAFISKQTGLSFVLKRIGPLATIITLAFYLLVLYLSAISKPPENLSVSIYSESFIETACQHLLLLVGFDTLIYRKYYDTPPILVGHHWPLTLRMDQGRRGLFGAMRSCGRGSPRSLRLLRRPGPAEFLWATWGTWLCPCK